ncbi:MAG: hypothetical protein ACOCUD_05160 [Bacillota bacterium]
MPEQFDQLAEKLEETYKKLEKTMDEIADLKNTLHEIENSTDQIIDKYSDLIETKKYKNIQKDNNDVLKKISDHAHKIDESLSNIENYKRLTIDKMEQFINRIQKFESSYGKPRKNIETVEITLNKLLNQASKERRNSDDKLVRASKLFHVSAEIEHYDHLLQLQKENNALLKKVLNKLDSSNNNHKK